MEMERALANLAALAANPYPGRGIVIGRDEKGDQVQVYWIMGRSENSRNRVFVEGEQGGVHTSPADPAKVKDPSLIIYDAMLEGYGWCVVSNGHQTKAVIHRAMMEAGPQVFVATMRQYMYEPDAPNFTPRISAICARGRRGGALSLIRRSLFDDTCQRQFFEYEELPMGYGYCLTTYSGDGNPLPPFQGEPYLLPLPGHITMIAGAIWEALNSENRIALAVKLIPEDGGPSQVKIINRFVAA
jgi:IMP cyclohydrolase